MTEFSSLVVGLDTSALKNGKTALEGITRAGAATEAGVVKSMKGVEAAVKAVPVAAKEAARGFEEFRASIDPAYAASQQFAAAQKEIARFVSDGAISQRVANSALEQAASKYMGVATSAQRAADAQRAAELATHEAAQSYTALRASLDPMYASSRSFEAAQEQLNLALKQGVITQADYNRVLAMAEKQYLGAGVAVSKASTSVKAATGGMNSFAYQSRMAAMQLSQVAQQTMAGGGFIRALAIQLPDLALGFGAVGIAAGVAAGVMLPMAASFLTGSDNAEELDEAITKLQETSRAFIDLSSQTRRSVSELSTEFGVFAGEIQRTYEILQGVALERTLDGLGVAIAGLDVARLEFLVGIFQEGSGEIQAFSQNYNDALAEIKESFNLTGSQAEAFLGQLNALKTADGPEEIVKAADSLNKFLIEAYGSARNIPPELREMVQRLAEAQTVAARVASEVDGSANSANLAATAAANLSGQLSVAAQHAAQLAANLAMAPAGIQGFQDKAAQLTAQISALDAGYSQIQAGAAGYRKELEQKYGLATAASEAENAYISAVINRQVTEYENVQNLNKAYTDKVTALNKVDKAAGAGGAAKALNAAAKEAKQLADEIERLEFDADPLKKYNAELANLNLLAANGLSDGAYAKAVADLNEEFANSNPLVSKIGDAIGDFVAGGMRDFKSLLGAFKNMLKEMIATAIANPIKLALSGAMGIGGAANAGTGGGGIASGLMGKVLGGFGSNGSILGLGGLGGGSGLLGGLGNAVSGGLGNIFSIGANAAAAGGGFMATLGAAVPVLGIAAAAISFFSTKTKILGNGIRITADNMGTLAESFETVKKTKFWGLSSKTSTNYKEMDADNPISQAVDKMRADTAALGAILGLGADNFASFASSMEFSLKDMNEEQANAEIQRRLGIMADQFSYAALGHFQETYGGVIREGETATEAMTSLATSLQAANYAFQDMGFTLFEASIQGAMAAREFADIFGGVETMLSTTAAYFQRFYSEGEQTAAITLRMKEAMAELGLIMPSTIAGFRALVEQAESLGDTARAAQLIQLSSSFSAMIDAQDSVISGLDSVLATATSDLQASFSSEMEAVSTRFEAAIAELEDSLTGARETLANSKAIATALETALNKRIFPSIDAQRQSQDQAANYLRSLLGLSRINDLDALNDALGAVASPSADTYATLEDYRRDFARTSGVIAALEETADIALAADEQAVLLLEQQLAEMQSQFDFEMDLLQSQLDALLGINDGVLSLADAISAFKVAQAALSNATTPGAAAIGEIYTDVLGRAADAAGLAFYSGLFAGGMSIDAIRSDIAGSSEALTGVMPSFDGGGWTGAGSRSGGLDGKGGFAAMLHPNETVIDHTRGGGSSADMIAELRGLRAEVAQLNASNLSIARSTNSSAATSRKWDEIGLPGTADGEVVKTEAA